MTLWVTCNEPLPSNVMLCITYTFVYSTRVATQPVDVPRDGVLVAEIPTPLGPRRLGPMLLAMDLCVPDGEGLVSVSNTVASLFNI